MTDIDKLRALLPHWMEHNGEHASEFERWAALAESAGHAQAAALIRAAAQQMAQANGALQEALDDLGGPVSLDMGHTHKH